MPRLVPWTLMLLTLAALLISSPVRGFAANAVLVTGKAIEPLCFKPGCQTEQDSRLLQMAQDNAALEAEKRCQAVVEPAGSWLSQRNEHCHTIDCLTSDAIVSASATFLCP